MKNKEIENWFFAALDYCFKEKFRGQKGAQMRLAEIAGVSRSAINEALKHDKGHSPALQTKIAYAFGYNLSDFLDFGRDLLSGKPPPSPQGLTISDLPSPNCRLVDNFTNDYPERWKHLENEFISVPLVSGEVAAGQPILSETYIVGAGFGYYFNDFDTEGPIIPFLYGSGATLSVDNGWGAHVCAGIDVEVQDNVFLTLDAEYAWTIIDGSVSTPGFYDTNFDTRVFTTGVGIKFAF